MFNIERIVGWLMSVALLGALVWSVTGFVSDPGESRRPPVEPTPFSLDEVGSAPVRERIARAPASPDAVAGPYTLGDDEALDDLWQQCKSGTGVSCDRLFEVSPIGSDYERFGLTCGDRPLVLNCSDELVEP